MGLTGLLALVILALLAVTVKFVTDGARERNRKKAALAIALFCAVLLLMYVGLLRFITSM